jgi:hypothetical protein
MKIEVRIFGTVLGKAIEHNCQSLIINGIEVIRNGEIAEEHLQIEQPQNTGQVVPLEELN